MNSFTKPAYFTKLTAAVFLALAALMLNSCSKDPDPIPEVSFLNIANTSPTLASYNVYVAQNRVNPGALGFGGVVPYGQYSPGTASVKFTTASSTESIITKNVNLEANTAHSLFLIDKGDKLDYLVLKDQLGDISSAKTFIRFINLSPDAGAADLVIKDGNTVVAGKAYKASSEFIELEAKAYVFEIREKTTERIVTVNLDAKAGKSYTLLAVGLLNPTDIERAFSSQLITNQ